jgi:hypothetical protein
MYLCSSTFRSWFWILVLGTAWLCGAAVGLDIVWRHAFTPGFPGSPPSHWPSESRLPRDARKPTLVLIAHPHCPCTRASLGELLVILTRYTGPLDCDVVFVRPQGVPEGWERTDAWSEAEAIPGVNVSCDAGGFEARTFGVFTSGHVLLYDAGGDLLFSGGVTASRGHSGDSEGRDAVLSWLARGRAEIREMPVFGCSLFEFDSDELHDRKPE